MRSAPPDQPPFLRTLQRTATRGGANTVRRSGIRTKVRAHSPPQRIHRSEVVPAAQSRRPWRHSCFNPTRPRRAARAADRYQKKRSRPYLRSLPASSSASQCSYALLSTLHLAVPNSDSVPQRVCRDSVSGRQPPTLISSEFRSFSTFSIFRPQRGLNPVRGSWRPPKAAPDGRSDSGKLRRRIWLRRRETGCHPIRAPNASRMNSGHSGPSGREGFVTPI